MAMIDTNDGKVENASERILLISPEIMIPEEKERISQNLVLFPPLGISTIKRYINENTRYSAKAFDAGIKITNKVLDDGFDWKILLDNEYIERMIELDDQRFNDMVDKAKRIRLENIPDDEKFRKKRKIIYNIKMLIEIIESSGLRDFGNIGFSIMTEIALRYSLLLARIIKRIYPEKRIILGGMFFNEDMKGLITYDFIDFLVIGKGLESIAHILDLNNEKEPEYLPDGKIVFKESGKINEIASKENPKNLPCLETLPDYDDFPRADYIRYGKSFSLPFLFSSGCKYNCAYCAWNKFDKEIETADLTRTVDGLIALKKRYEPDYFYIMNSSLNRSNESLSRFCKTLIDRNANIRYVALANPENIDNNAARLLKDSGCVSLLFGMESFDDNILALMRKSHRRESALKSIGNCKDNGINTIICYITGLPGETEETMDIARRTITEGDYADDYSIFEFELLVGSDIFNNPGKYNVKNISITKKMFRVPLQYGFDTDKCCWTELKKKNVENAQELRELFINKMTKKENMRKTQDIHTR